MTLKTTLDQFGTAVGADIKALQLKDAELGDRLSVLSEQVKNASGIDDDTPSNEKGYSSNKVNALMTAQKDELTTAIAQSTQAIKNELLNGAAAEYDTLKEIGDYINEDKSTGASLATAIAHRVRYDEAQVLTPEQQKQALANLGLDGVLELDLVAVYRAAKS